MLEQLYAKHGILGSDAVNDISFDELQFMLS